MLLSLKASMILLFCLMILTSCCVSAQDTEIPMDNAVERNVPEVSPDIPSLPRLPDSQEYTVVEPVSNGDAYIYEAGMDHPESVLLIHGVGDEASRIWGLLIPELAKQYHVVTFDLPGFGRSSKQNILYSPAFYAEFIKWVKETYVKDRPLTVIGHSLGGAVAICYGAMYPDNLQRLILADVSGVVHRKALTMHIIESNPSHEGFLKAPLRLFDRLKSNTMSAAEFQSLSDRIDKSLESPAFRSRVLKNDPQKIAGLALANSDLSSMIYGIKVPAVIIWGADDPVTPLRTGKVLAHTLQTAQLNIIPQTGHNPIRERPDLFNSMIQDAIVTESFQLPWKPPEKTDRVVEFIGKSELALTGYYRSIKISSCESVTIQNLEAEHMEVVSSEVSIENSWIHGKECALEARGAIVKMTGVLVTGQTAVIASGCELDLAGVELIGYEAAVKAINGSNILFSVSRITSPYNNGYVHGPYEVVKGKPL